MKIYGFRTPNIYICFWHECRSKAAVAEGIGNLIVYLQKRGFKNSEWVGAIPLYHFLKGCVQPFEKPETNPERIVWGEKEKELKLDEVRWKAEPGLVYMCNVIYTYRAVFF